MDESTIPLLLFLAMVALIIQIISIVNAKVYEKKKWHRLIKIIPTIAFLFIALSFYYLSNGNYELSCIAYWFLGTLFAFFTLISIYIALFIFTRSKDFR